MDQEHSKLISAQNGSKTETKQAKEMETDKSQGRGSRSWGPSPPSPGSCHVAAPLACEASSTPAAEASPPWILSLWLCFAAWAAGSGDKQGRQPRAAEWETVPRAAGCASLAQLLTHPSAPIASPTGAQMRPGTGLAALSSQQGERGNCTALRRGGQC